MMKEITKDTQRAIEAIKPIADELGINIDADEQFMYLNNQAIGISCNSTFATLMEFIGFVFMTTYNKNVIVTHNGKVSEWLRSLIKRNWMDMKTVRAIQRQAEENKRLEKPERIKNDIREGKGASRKNAGGATQDNRGC